MDGQEFEIVFLSRDRRRPQVDRIQCSLLRDWKSVLGVGCSSRRRDFISVCLQPKAEEGTSTELRRLQTPRN